MTIPRPNPAGRFDPEMLFRPASVAVIGADTERGGRVLANLVLGGFTGKVEATAHDAPLAETPDLAVIATAPDGIVPAMERLAAKGCFAAIVLGPADAAADPASLAAASSPGDAVPTGSAVLRGDAVPTGSAAPPKDAVPTGSAVPPAAAIPLWAAVPPSGAALAKGAGLAAVAARTGVRVLGPHSFGLAVPRIGLNATLSHITPPAGRIALVSQSAGTGRSVIDWAGPNGVGFSHVVGIGGNQDIGF